MTNRHVGFLSHILGLNSDIFPSLLEGVSQGCHPVHILRLYVTVYMIVLYSVTPLRKWLAITIHPIFNLKNQNHMLPHIYLYFGVFLFLVDGGECGMGDCIGDR